MEMLEARIASDMFMFTVIKILGTLSCRWYNLLNCILTADFKLAYLYLYCQKCSLDFLCTKMAYIHGTHFIHSFKGL